MFIHLFDFIAKYYIIYIHYSFVNLRMQTKEYKVTPLLNSTTSVTKPSIL